GGSRLCILSVLRSRRRSPVRHSIGKERQDVLRSSQHELHAIGKLLRQRSRLSRLALRKGIESLRLPLAANNPNRQPHDCFSIGSVERQFLGARRGKGEILLKRRQQAR